MTLNQLFYLKTDQFPFVKTKKTKILTIFDLQTDTFWLLKTKKLKFWPFMTTKLINFDL